MLESFTAWSDPLALVRHLLPFLPTADGSVRAHWTMARALCSIAEQVVLRTLPQPDAPLSALMLAEMSAGTDELGRLLLRHLPFDDAAARQAWPQVQAYLLQVLPLVEQLLMAETPPWKMA
jgi:hypothetical protein